MRINTQYKVNRALFLENGWTSRWSLAERIKKQTNNTEICSTDREKANEQEITQISAYADRPAAPLVPFHAHLMMCVCVRKLCTTHIQTLSLFLSVSLSWPVHGLCAMCDKYWSVNPASYYTSHYVIRMICFRYSLSQWFHDLNWPIYVLMLPWSIPCPQEVRIWWTKVRLLRNPASRHAVHCRLYFQVPGFIFSTSETRWKH